MDELTPQERDESLSFFRRHRTKIITGGIAVVAVAASAFAIQKALNAGEEAEKVTTKVRVIERNSSNCLPRKGETQPRRPILCKAGFDKAIQLISPLQACQIVAKGARLIVINGRRVSEIECIEPTPRRSRASVPPGIQGAREPTETAAEGDGQGASPEGGSPRGSSPGRQDPDGGQRESPSTSPSPPPSTSPPSQPSPSPPPAEAPPTPVEPGNRGVRDNPGARGEDRSAVEVEVPVPIDVCTKLVKLNCR